MWSICRFHATEGNFRQKETQKKRARPATGAEATAVSPGGRFSAFGGTGRNGRNGLSRAACWLAFTAAAPGGTFAADALLFTRAAAPITGAEGLITGAVPLAAVG